MTKEEFDNKVKSLILINTVSADPKVPMHFFSAYIDGKLYRGPKGKTVWNRKCDVTNSLRYNTDLFRFLRETYETEVYEAHPEFFYKTLSWQRIPYTKSEHLKEVTSIVESKIDEWWKEHVEIREVLQSN